MRRSNFNQIFWGFVILLVGVLFLAQNLGYLQDYSFWRYLPALLIVLGAYQMLINRFRAWIGPLLTILLGSYLLLATLKIITWGTFASLIWPTILILVGLAIILQRGVKQHIETTSSDSVSIVTIFGDHNKKIANEEFKGGEVSAIFGGSKLDLTESRITQPPATIQTTTMFGGVQILAPSDWDIDIQTVNFFGGSSDSRHAYPERKSTPDLVITGTVMFGGFEVKS